MSTANLNTLKTELTDLKTSAAEQSQKYQSSKDLLYRTLVKSYLWWRRASGQNGYLDDLYKTAGITANKTGNQANFSPLIKLIWGMTEKKHDGTVARWNGALRVIDAEFINNQTIYQSDPSTLLVSFIRDEGGLTAMREKAVDYDVEEGNAKRTKLKPKDAKVRTAEIKSGIDFFKAAPTMATVDDIDPILATKDGLVAAVGRINGAGTFELLATSDDDALVRDLAADCADADTSQVPTNLRLIAEVIATQALPAKLARFSKRLAEGSDIPVTDAEGNKVGKLKKKALPRLLVRPGKGDILLSNARCNNVSVVTRARPKTPFVSSGNDIYLNGNDRSMIEKAYIQQRQLRFMAAVPQDTVKVEDTDKKAAFCIDTTHNVTEKKRTLHFYDSPANEREHQADYDDSVGFVPSWKYELNIDWLKHLQVDCVGWWVNHHGGHIGRPKNRSFSLKLTDKAWTVAWGDEEEREYYNSTIPLRDGCTAVGVNGGLDVNVLSKDFLSVFNAIAAAPISSQKIVVEGDAHMMKIGYATHLAEYDVFIPFCDAKHKRFQTHFKNV